MNISQIEQWKALGQKIVFTNGCFDLLHYGHILSLKECAKFGDKLIVGLNSDSSVKRLKGEDRPLIDEQIRMKTLESLKCVDMVVVFNGDTPLELIKSIIPDVLAKGDDYSIENIVGSDIVIANGGKVRTIPKLSGYSTTALIEKIKSL